MEDPILVTGAAGRVGAVGRTVTELLLERGKAVRAMVRNEDERAQSGVRQEECGRIHCRSRSGLRFRGAPRRADSGAATSIQIR